MLKSENPAEGTAGFSLFSIYRCSQQFLWNFAGCCEGVNSNFLPVAANATNRTNLDSGETKRYIECMNVVKSRTILEAAKDLLTHLA